MIKLAKLQHKDNAIGFGMSASMLRKNCHIPHFYVPLDHKQTSALL